MANTRIIIKGSTLLKDVPNVQLKALCAGLTFDNPDYKQAVKSGRSTHGLPKYKFLYRRRGSTSIIIPRGSTGTAVNLLRIPIKEIVDHTVSPTIDIDFKGTLREYQEEAVSAVLKKRYGIMCGATGSGKTVMGTAMASKRGLTTLVIVHNRELQGQWVDAFTKFTTVTDIGIIGGGTYEVGDVTIGIINSVNKIADQIKDEFGLVIYDECHRTMGETWVKTINILRPKFHIGLSATPFRRDKGTTKALFQLVGPLLHTVDRGNLEDTGAILVPRVAKVPTRFSYRFNNDYSKMLSTLTQNWDRNYLIGNTIINDFRKYKEPMMVVSDRVSHCEELHELINEQHGVRSVVVHGKLKKEVRKAAIEGVKSGKYNTLIATISLLGEGFDAPDLNSIFLTTPMRFKGRLIQLIGRVLRPSENGVGPRVYDFRDTLIKTLRNSGFARDRVYNTHGWHTR